MSDTHTNHYKFHYNLRKRLLIIFKHFECLDNLHAASTIKDIIDAENQSVREIGII